MPIAKDGSYAMNPTVGKNRAAAREKDSGKAKHRLHGIRIEAAKNGFTVRHEYRMRKGAKTEEKGSPAYPEDTTHVFESADAALKHVQGNMPEFEE